MSRVVLRLFAAVLWSFWMLVVVPGHERGIVPLCPDCMAASPAAALPQCCRHDAPAPSKAPARSQRPCAICYMSVNLGATPVTLPVVLPLARLAFSPPPMSLASVDQRQPASGRCRGPPHC